MNKEFLTTKKLKSNIIIIKERSKFIQFFLK